MKTQLLNDLYELGRKIGKYEEYLSERETGEDSDNEKWNDMVKPLIEQKDKLIEDILNER